MKQKYDSLAKSVFEFEYYLRQHIYYYYVQNNNDKMEVIDKIYSKFIEFMNISPEEIEKYSKSSIRFISGREKEV